MEGYAGKYNPHVLQWNPTSSFRAPLAAQIFSATLSPKSKVCPKIFEHKEMPFQRDISPAGGVQISPGPPGFAACISRKSYILPA
jgi:hypothetical protein